ncbi:DHA2 family efflux MFS transporter permease subunit [Paractinoplanes durhamensis]|uniref:MFS transporter n=1 Tax=Paractinoplanes durhamensis TaxID=113563 RepID=A0ABQ3ZAE2_9ACTN|nr:DHA2 family efflux MFS transporter permease subunit [Actinoplanes durhamensis]GIE06756.1 MFS transporter [Actinoplanes durhamensis]
MVTSKSRWYALAALALSTLAIGLDTTILSVALPTLSRDLHASTGDLQWFTNSYLLVLAAVLLPAGMLGDRFGRKKLLLGALFVFGAASAACARAAGTGELIAARTALGLGAAVIMPLSGSVLTVLFKDKERSRALGIWLTASALGIPLGPLLGGWLLDNFWWGSVFLINVPLIAVALVAVTLWVPESHGDRTRRFDPLGVLLSASGLVALTYGIIEAGDRGWSDARSLTTMIAGVLALIAFVVRQRTAKFPLVDLDLFRSRQFTGGAVLATVASFGMLGLMFSLPQFYSAVEGQDAFGSGLRLLPVIGGLLVGARTAEKIAARIGSRLVIAGGLALMTAALLLGATTSATSGFGFIAVWVSLAGLGLGFTLPPSMDAALGALTPERSGVGNGLIQAMRQVGGAIGVAVLGTVLNGAYRDALPAAAGDATRESVAAGVTGDPALLGAVRAAFTHGMDVSLVVAAAVAAAGVVLALVMLPGRTPPPAAAVEAERLTLAESGL